MLIAISHRTLIVQLSRLQSGKEKNHIFQDVFSFASEYLNCLVINCLFCLRYFGSFESNDARVREIAKYCGHCVSPSLWLFAANRKKKQLKSNHVRDYSNLAIIFLIVLRSLSKFLFATVTYYMANCCCQIAQVCAAMCGILESPVHMRYSNVCV